MCVAALWFRIKEPREDAKPVIVTLSQSSGSGCSCSFVRAPRLHIFDSILQFAILPFYNFAIVISIVISIYITSIMLPIASMFPGHQPRDSDMS